MYNYINKRRRKKINNRTAKTKQLFFVLPNAIFDVLGGFYFYWNKMRGFSRSAIIITTTTTKLMGLPDESEAPWNGSSFCRLAFGGPSTKWSAMVLSKFRGAIIFYYIQQPPSAQAEARRSYTHTLAHTICRDLYAKHMVYIEKYDRIDTKPSM